MIEGLVIAAGLSSRMGDCNKLCLKIGGESVISRTVMGIRPYCERIVVVTGFQRESIEQALAKVDGVEFVFNSDFADGMFSSVKCGLREITAERCIFTTGDSPFASDGAIRLILESSSEVAVACCYGLPGHPVAFGRKTIDRLLRGECGPNLRDCLMDCRPEFIETGCRGVLMDIDTMQDYEKALAFFKSGREAVRP